MVGGQGECSGLRRLEFVSTELIDDDLRVANEQGNRRVIKRAAPTKENNQDNKKPKHTDTEDAAAAANPQEMMMKMVMQMMHQVQRLRVKKGRKS